MNESNDQQVQKADNTSEYLKFVALLVVFLVVILALAALSPRLIGEVMPAVLGLGGAPAEQSMPAAEENPEIEGAPAGSAVPEQSSPGKIQEETGAQNEILQHEVQEGQTLFQIAELYGVSVQQLAAANNLVSPAQLQVGAILIIPQ